MEHAKLANEVKTESSGKSSLRKKLASTQTKPSRPLRKGAGAKSKSDRLVCRYCGSDDLAPSFIKRRDRRCRKCFAKRYGSGSPAKKTKAKK